MKKQKHNFSEQTLRVLTREKKRIIAQCPVCKGQSPKGCPECSKAFDIYIKMADACLPLKLWNLELDWLVDPDLRGRVGAYINKLPEALDRGIGLYLYGSNGTGKTASAIIILKEVLRRNYTARFTTLSEIITMQCDGMYNPQARARLRKEILEVHFLVVDDISKTYRSENSNFMDASCDVLFRTRANECLPTIITSNKTREKLWEEEGSFGQSLLSLFAEHLIDVTATGVDRRKAYFKPELEKFLDE